MVWLCWDLHILFQSEVTKQICNWEILSTNITIFFLSYIQKEFIYIFFNLFYWSIAHLKYCVNFCSTVMWVIYKYIYICVCVYIYIHIHIWRREWQPTPVFLSGESHGQRSLTGYSPWGHKELDMPEQLTHTHKTYNTYTHSFSYSFPLLFITGY